VAINEHLQQEAQAVLDVIEVKFLEELCDWVRILILILFQLTTSRIACRTRELTGVAAAALVACDLRERTAATAR
jgi:hypothetical protein